jgi:hypothetical protein
MTVYPVNRVSIEGAFIADATNGGVGLSVQTFLDLIKIFVVSRVSSRQDVWKRGNLLNCRVSSRKLGHRRQTGHRVSARPSRAMKSGTSSESRSIGLSPDDRGADQRQHEYPGPPGKVFEGKCKKAHWVLPLANVRRKIVPTEIVSICESFIGFRQPFWSGRLNSPPKQRVSAPALTANRENRGKTQQSRSQSPWLTFVSAARMI